MSLNVKHSKYIDWYLIVGFLLIFLTVRAIRLLSDFHFLHDQALFSLKALEIWKYKIITLIGPPTSLALNGRYIFQGGAIYYFLLVFLALGRFDPYYATWAFTFFSGLMLIPLYYGTKNLISRQSAIILMSVYALAPWYIVATSELWNPYFQFALLPILIWLLSKYDQTNRDLWLFGTSVFGGFLLQFHYQFFVVILSLFIYLIVKKRNVLNLALFIFGILLGFSPMIIFEFRNDFYNLNTLWLYLHNLSLLLGESKGPPPHYLISIILMSVLAVLKLTHKKLLNKHLLVFTVLLAITSLFTLLNISKHEKSLGWSYKDEIKAYNIIRNNSVKDYNITAFYQAVATPQKYFHLRDNIIIKSDDYYNNQYLYVMYENENFINDQAYEMNSFQPSKILNSWPINDRYNLYLVERLVNSIAK